MLHDFIKEPNELPWAVDTMLQVLIPHDAPDIFTATVDVNVV